MGLWLGTDADRFGATAGTWLAARPERNALATVFASVEAGRYDRAIFALATGPGGEPTLAAIRTPPHRMLISGGTDDAHAFMAAWLNLDPDCTGVGAAPDLARACCRAFSDLTGRPTRRHVAEGLHMLERVNHPARPAPGCLRAASWRELTQLADWGAQFAQDAHMTSVAGARAGVIHQLDHGRLYVWEHLDRAVAMIGHTVLIDGDVRIGPVYTPPALRGRGYATAMTAALSQQLLDGGARRCLLFTDLANPVSNHVYAGLGYVRISEAEQHDFLGQATSLHRV